MEILPKLRGEDGRGGGNEMNRNLDGCYFRTRRDGKWQNICFSDLTDEERGAVCKGRSAEWLQSLAYHLAGCLHGIGDKFGIFGGGEEAE